jgi:signal peptidase II
VQRKVIVLCAIALGVVALDQWTKYLVVKELTFRLDGAANTSERLGAMYSKEGIPPAPDGYHFRPKRSINVSDNFFRIRYAENPGAAWGLFRGIPENFRVPLFHLVTLLAVGLISAYFLKLSGAPNERWVYFGLPLILGGALGNWIDRVARGFVVDFLEAHWMDRAYWPSFNIADSAICIGVGMMVVDWWVRRERKAPASSTISAVQEK